MLVVYSAYVYGSTPAPKLPASASKESLSPSVDSASKAPGGAIDRKASASSMSSEHDGEMYIDAMGEGPAEL